MFHSCSFCSSAKCTKCVGNEDENCSYEVCLYCNQAILSLISFKYLRFQKLCVNAAVRNMLSSCRKSCYLRYGRSDSVDFQVGIAGTVTGEKKRQIECSY